MSSSSSFSSSSSPSSEEKRPFDVFINFRGVDVRYGFVADLHKCLLHGGINAYIDSEDLRRGDEIEAALTKAIKESRIAVLVFSENYASSRWCLDELVKVMECRRHEKQQVLPVFYKVEPGVIRGQRESYGKALASHEKKLGKDSERVKKWRRALTEAGNLSGWHYVHGDDTKFIESIVKEISTIVAREPLNVAEYPVGVGRRVEKVMSLLSMGADDVRMIGIWGTGGVGKTTISKDVYNSIARQFGGCSFLANVRETSSRPDGLVHLQKTLLSQILWKENLVVLSVDGGANLIRDILCCRKILLVLDDVDHGKQLNALARECEWFGKGSRIIVTTRDKHVLTSHGIDQVYEVEPLDQVEAFELLSSHAFPRNQTKDIRRDLTYNILGYANGLPLAIKVLGSLLCSRSREEWESILKNLAESPNKDINDVLKISFDALDSNQKDIFLDIACFFKGRDRDYVIGVLDGCGLKAFIGIQTLIERSLVTIENKSIVQMHQLNNKSTVQMHDLIQLMGQDIVKHECLDDPGKRSRLWCYDDVYEVLSVATGTNAVKGIVLQLPSQGELDISPNAFTRMRRLKLLILLNAQISGGPVCLPNDLRWLEWPGCPLSTLKFSAGPKKLVCFDVHDSQIKEFGGNLKGFENLKFINLSYCQSLVYMPDLSCTPNLEQLNLCGCKNLERAHESVAYHCKLRLLDLKGCSNLHHLSDVLRTMNLQLLNLVDCLNLQRFPDIPDKINGLQELSLSGTSIEELPASIENLVSLKELILSDCKKLAILPSSIYRLQNLERLRLDGCSKLIEFPKEEEDLSDPHTKTGFPMLTHLNLRRCHLSEVEFLENFSCFPCLKNLNLSGNNFTNLPTCEQLYNLYRLAVSNCQQLQEIPKIPGKLTLLEATNCKSLSRIPSNICDVEVILLNSCHELVRKGFFVNDWLNLKKFHGQTNRYVTLPGGEMPKWLVPNKDGCISFVASKDLYKKILGLAFCVVSRAERKGIFAFELGAFVDNIMANGHTKAVKSNDFLDHVWLEYMESKDLWRVDDFGPNDLGHFHVSIRLMEHGRLIVKKCGFRLICRPLENDLEVLLQDNQLLDPALFYEVSHEDSLTSTEEESSSETKGLQDSETCTEEQKLNMANFSAERRLEHEDNNQTSMEEDSSNGIYDKINFSAERRLEHEDNDQTSIEEDSSDGIHDKIKAGFSIEQKYRYSRVPSEFSYVWPGGEMPEEFILVEDGTISFKASRDLYNKFQLLFLCVVFGVEDGIKEISFEIVPHVHDQRRNGLSGTLGSFDSDRMWIQYLEPNVLWGLLEGEVDFSQFEESYLRFSLTVRVSGGTMKKLGYCLRRGLGDGFKVVDLASLCEDFDEPTDEVELEATDESTYEKNPESTSRLVYAEELEASDSEFD